MEASERDITQDWLLPEGAAPPLLGELEGRIDEAVTIARSSERAAGAASAAAVEAAGQARRAAELAERASAAAVSAATAEPVASSGPAPADDRMRRFSERADRVLRRLRAIDRPRGEHPASAGAGARRGGG